MSRLLVLAALPTLIVGLARSDTIVVPEDPIPLRRLCINAPEVVLAAPVEAATPTVFRVLVSLRGSLKAGDSISPPGLTPELVRTFVEPDFVGKKPSPRRIDQAILFLEPGTGGKGWTVMPGGMRMCGEDGKMLAPSGPRGRLEVQPGMRWSIVVERVKQDLAAVDQLNSYRRIGRPSRRVEAIMSWVQARKAEFTTTPPGNDESPAGWDRLQLDVFDWIFDAASPEDAWRAVRLYAELNQGDAPRLRTPVFSTPAGRAMLAGIAGDDKRLLGDRTRALRILAARETLWPTPRECKRGANVMDKPEQTTLLDQLAKLIQEKDDLYRVWLAQAIFRLGRSAPEQLNKMLPSLVRAYRESQPGSGRDQLAMTLCELAPEEMWRELSGNRAGYCACLRDLERHEATLTFWLSLKTPGPAVYEAPTLVLEKLGTLGFVSETKRYPIEPKNLASWVAGWDGEDALVVQFDVSKLTPGSIYRVKVEGVAGKGKDKVKWTSEPKKFKLPGRPNNQPGGPGLFYK